MGSYSLTGLRPLSNKKGLIMTEEKLTSVHINNVPVSLKNEWVKKAQVEGMKLGDWLTDSIKNSIVKVPENLVVNADKIVSKASAMLPDIYLNTDLTASIPKDTAVSFSNITEQLQALNKKVDSLAVQLELDKEDSEPVKRVYRELTADQFKQMRKDLGYTQTQLADELGRSKSAVTNYESGEEIPQIVCLAMSALVNEIQW